MSHAQHHSKQSGVSVLTTELFRVMLHTANAATARKLAFELEAWLIAFREEPVILNIRKLQRGCNLRGASHPKYQKIAKRMRFGGVRSSQISEIRKEDAFRPVSGHPKYQKSAKRMHFAGVQSSQISEIRERGYLPDKQASPSATQKGSPA